jgi:hypothetical protein
MAQPLMPKATAVWLIENTTLTFDQVAEFCGLHPLEVQSIADGEVAVGMVGYDPIASGQLTREELGRCQADPSARLRMAEANIPRPATRTKGPRYTPVARRQDRPDAIAWLLRSFPELGDGQVARLVGTTKPTINAVRERTHWNSANIKPRDPVALGLCSRDDLQKAIDKTRRTIERAEKRKAREAAKAAAAAEAAAGGGQGGAGTPADTTGETPAEAPADVPATDATPPAAQETAAGEPVAEDTSGGGTAGPAAPVWPPGPSSTGG